MAQASERDIQSAILDYLSRCSKVAFAYRQNTGQTKYEGGDGKTLLIGSENYAELMRGEIVNQRFDFRCELWREDANGRKILGLNVQVIPWMRGMVVMP